MWVFRLWLRPLSLFASLLFLVGETQIWPGDLRVRRCWWCVFLVCFTICRGIMEPRSFMMFLICLLAYPNVRTEPQCDIGHNRGKKNRVRLPIAMCFITSERCIGLALSGSLTATITLLSSYIRGFQSETGQFGSAQVPCVHQDYFAVPPRRGDGLPADIVRYVWARCSQLESWIAKLLFLPRGHQLADASRSTRERTLRGRILIVQLFVLLLQLHRHTFLCLTAIVRFVPDGCT